MRYPRRSLSIGIVLLIAISCFAATTSAQSGEENHPTEDDPYMYFWGNEDLSECWNNFDSNASIGSASEGYGEIFFDVGEDVDVEFSCNMQTGFTDDFILEINKSISIRMKFEIDSGNCGNDCTDLTLTLFRGQEQISQHIEPANSVNNGNDFTTQWDILVNDSIRAWAQDTQISISVAYSVPAEGGFQCQFEPPVPQSDCSGNFRMYYSDEGGSPGDVHAEFPIYVSLTDSGSNAGKTNLGPIIFILPFIAITLLLGWVGYREGWRAESEEEFDYWSLRVKIKKMANPIIWGSALVSGTKNTFSEWRKGGALTVNKTRRIVTLCLLYFAQGLPWGFASVTFAAYLVKNGTPIGDIALLFGTIALPWTFKWIWGPIVDSVFIERFGPRRQWILFAQTGMALTLGSLILIPDLNSKIELVTRILFVHNIFASLQDVATDALAVEILQPDEVAKVNGFMFAAKRGGIIVGGAVLGVLVSYIDISGVIVAQLVLLLAVIIIPLTMIEKPGVKLFPWSVQEAILSNSDEGQDGQDDEESETPWVDEIDFRVARTVGYSVSEEKISFASFFAIIGLSIWFLGFAIDVFTIDWSVGDSIATMTSPVSRVIILLAVLSLLVSKLNENLPSIINPFKLIPTSSRNAVARTSFYLIKAFSVRSAFILIFLCALSELYIFVGPIVIDIFINEAGWSQAKYNGIVGGIVVFGGLFGQIVGGLLGDKYGTRRVAMVGFTILALANATLAFLEPMWHKTTLMTFYLIIQAFVGGIAWICIISLSMRLTWSKVGGTQFTAYMSIFNASGVFAYTLTGRMIEVFNYSTAIYIGAALTMLTVIMLIFIDEDETDRVLEGRLDDDDEDGDESWWEEAGQVMEGAELGEHASLA